MGGIEGWEALSEDERATRDAAMMQDLIKALGQEAFEKLPECEKRELTIWVWAGCCMHKDQNAFKGANEAMMAGWQRDKLPGPIRLANKANAAVVRKVVLPERGAQPLTDEEVAILEACVRGGAKLVALAGAIFNNRCDKKGQGDSHQIYMENELQRDRIKRFPQTNNTRFGSHGEAAAELLAHLDTYISFLDHIRLRKVNDAWTNIEQNVYLGLQDDATLTELAVLALYQQVITHPYSRLVRKDEDSPLNALDLGPLHGDLLVHIQCLIDEPEILLNFSEKCYIDAAFDGRPFERPDCLSKIKELRGAGRLPHLQARFVDSLSGAKSTWTRFSAEFAADGIIAGLSDEERRRIVINPTNDVNEGSLGELVVAQRTSPNETLHSLNARAMFTRNHTQEFVDRAFQAEDHAWVWGYACIIDSSKLEAKRRKEQYEFEKRLVQMKVDRQAVRKEQSNKLQARLDSVPLIGSKDEIRQKQMTRGNLDDQLEKLRRRWGKKINIPKKSWIKKLPEKQAALESAFDQHIELLAQHSREDDTQLYMETEVRVESAWHEAEDEEMDCAEE